MERPDAQLMVRNILGNRVELEPSFPGTAWNLVERTVPGPLRPTKFNLPSD